MSTCQAIDLIKDIIYSVMHVWKNNAKIYRTVIMKIILTVKNIATFFAHYA